MITNSSILRALDRRETAATLGISTRTLDRLARNGHIRPLRVCRKPLYPRAEISRFLKRSES